jgi:hypothetical protein
MILGHGFGHRSVAFMMAGFSLMILSFHQLNLYLPEEIIILINIVMAVLFFNHKTMAALSTVRHRYFGYSGNKAEK